MQANIPNAPRGAFVTTGATKVKFTEDYGTVILEHIRNNSIKNAPITTTSSQSVSLSAVRLGEIQFLNNRYLTSKFKS